MTQYPLFFIPCNNTDMRLCDGLMRCFYPRKRFVVCRLKDEYMSCLKYNLFYDLVWFGLVYLTLARGPVLSKLILASGSSLEDLRVSE